MWSTKPKPITHYTPYILLKQQVRTTHNISCPQKYALACARSLFQIDDVRINLDKANWYQDLKRTPTESSLHQNV